MKSYSLRESSSQKCGLFCFGTIWGHFGQKIKIYLHNSKKCSTFAAEMEEKRNKTMNESVFVEFKSEEERLAALRKMVGLRKVWEARVRELMAKHPEMQVAQ